MHSLLAAIIFACTVAEEFSDDELRQAHKDVDENKDAEATRDELLHFTEHHQRAVDLEHTNPESEFKRKDASGDGFVTLEEHLKDTADSDFEKEKFKAADKSGDGKLDRSEMDALISPQTDEKMLNVVVSHSMTELDKDKSGAISFEEFKDSDMAQSLNRGKDDDGKEGEEAQASARDKDKALNELGEGEEASEEVERDAAAQKLFKRLDTNSDGTLDGSELRPLASGRIEREDMVDDYVKKVDNDGDKTVDSAEMIAGKPAISDAAIQDYLIAWAKLRQIRGMSAAKVV